MEKTLRRIVVDPETTEATGLSRTTRWRLERAGKFPKSVRLASGRVGYYADELAEWQASRPRAEDAPVEMPRSPGRYPATRKAGSSNA